MSAKKMTKETKDAKGIHSPAEVGARKKARMSMGGATPSPSMKTRGIHINVNGKSRTSPTISSKDSFCSTPGSAKSSVTTPGSRKRSLPSTPSEPPCFGIPVQVIAPKKRKVGRNNGSGEDNQNDYFCWLCHEDGMVVCCELCPRVYHTRCVGVTGKLPQDWVCPECQKIMRAECVDTRSHAMSMLTLDQRCTLFKFALQRMKHAECEPFQKPVDPSSVPNYADYIFNPMDLTTLEKNIKKKLYGCTEAFMADTKWILHNCVIFNGSQHKLTRSAKMITKICRHEMNEIEVCPDCYLNSCMKRNDEWFCEICRNPHTVVWAKLKGYPFWPAKVLREQDAQVDVRFFGAHDRSWIQVSQVFLYSRDSPVPIKNRRGGMDNALRETEIYIDKYNKTIGEFKYTAYRTPYDKTHVYAHTKKKVGNIRLKSLKTPISKSMSPVKLHKSASLCLTPGKIPDAKSMDRIATKKAASALKCKYNSIITTRRGAAALRSPDSEKHTDLSKMDIISSVGLRKLQVGLTKVKLEKGKKGVTLNKKAKESHEEGVFEFSNNDVVNEAKSLNIMESNPLPSVLVKLPDKKILAKVEKVVKDFEDSLCDDNDHSDGECNKDASASPEFSAVSRLNLISNIKKEVIDDNKELISKTTNPLTDSQTCNLKSGSNVCTNVNDNNTVSDVNTKTPSPSGSLTNAQLTSETISPPEKASDEASLHEKTDVSDGDGGENKIEFNQKVSGANTKFNEKLNKTIESCREKLGLSKDEVETDSESDSDDDSDEDEEEDVSDKDKSIEKTDDDDHKVVEEQSIEEPVLPVDTPKPDNSAVAEKASPPDHTAPASSTSDASTSEQVASTSEQPTKEQANSSCLSLSDTSAPSDTSLNTSDIVSKDTCTVSVKTSVVDAKVTGNGDSAVILDNDHVLNKTDNSVSDKDASVTPEKATTPVDPEEDMGLVMEVESESGLIMEVDTESDNELMIDLDRGDTNDDDDDDGDKTDSNSVRSGSDLAGQALISEKQGDDLVDTTSFVVRSSPSFITTVSGTTNSFRPIHPKPLQSLAQSVANTSVVLTSDTSRPVFVVVDQKGLPSSHPLKTANITVKSIITAKPSSRVIQARQHLSNIISLSGQKDATVPQQRLTSIVPVTKTLNVPTSVGVQFRKTFPTANTANSDSSLDLSKYADKIMSVVSETINEIQKDISGQESYQSSLKTFLEEVERLKWEHQQSMDELKLGLEKTVNELRAGWELQKAQLSAELRSQFVIEKQQAIEETKKKQWCAYCGKQAIFYCCWNTSYCDYPCQTSHWPEHMHTCSQSQTGSEAFKPRVTGQVADHGAKDKSGTPSPGQGTASISSQVQRAVSIQQSPHKAIQPHHATDADKWKEKMRENLQSVLKRQEAEKVQERQRISVPKSSSGPVGLSSVGPMKVSTVDGQMYLSGGGTQMVTSSPQIIPTPPLPPQQSPIPMQYLHNTGMANPLGPAGGQAMQTHINAFHSVPQQQVTIPVGPQPGMPMIGQHTQPPMMQHRPMMQQAGGGSVVYPINIHPGQQQHRMLPTPGVSQNVLQNGQIIFTQIPQHQQMGRPPTLPNMMMSHRPQQIQPRHF